MSNQFQSKLLAGVGRTNITPSEMGFLAGFAAREHAAEGIHDSLTATALALSKDGKTAIIVALDLLEIPDSLMVKIWEECSSRFSLEPHRMLINCSHTHAGPLLEKELYCKSPVETRH